MSIALVLAGGKSRRMGQDKAMIELAGKPLIAHSIERMRKQAQHVLIAANHDYQTGLPFIPDHDDGPQGPVAALWAARRYLDKAKLDSSGFVSVPVDSPFLPDDLIDRLAQTPNTARFASTPQHKHIACAYWPLARLRSALDSLESPATASPSLRQILTACDALSVHWPDETPFININTPEDLAYAKTCFTQNAAASKD